MSGYYCSIISMEKIFMNTENSKISELHKFVLIFSQKLNLRNSTKHVALQNLSIYYNWKNIRQQYKNNKLKIIAPTKWQFWIDWLMIFSVRYSRLYQVHKKHHETSPSNPPIHLYFNRINNRFVFKIKDGL